MMMNNDLMDHESMNPWIHESPATTTKKTRAYDYTEDALNTGGKCHWKSHQYEWHWPWLEWWCLWSQWSQIKLVQSGWFNQTCDSLTDQHTYCNNSILYCNNSTVITSYITVILRYCTLIIPYCTANILPTKSYCAVTVPYYKLNILHCTEQYHEVLKKNL